MRNAARRQRSPLGHLNTRGNASVIIAFEPRDESREVSDALPDQDPDSSLVGFGAPAGANPFGNPTGGSEPTF